MRTHLLTLLCFSVVFLHGAVSFGADSNTQQDIVTKSKSGDLLTSPPQKKKAAATDAVTTKTKNDKNKSKASQPAAQTQPSTIETAKPAKDYLDVYVGKCQFTAEAITSVKRFAAEHANLFIRFYGMKTQSEVMPDIEVLKGLEIYLPIEAKRFGITTVPTFILNTRGAIYKVSGATDIADVYEQVTKQTVRGERKKGYTDLGDQGRGCPAITPDLRPSALTLEQRQQILAEGRAPDMRGVLLSNRVTVQQSSQPVYIERQVTRLPLSSRFIVFSRGQTDWAIKELKHGTSTGCCTDCLELTKLWPYAQYCDKGLLAKMGVRSVPTIITFRSGTQQ